MSTEPHSTLTSTDTISVIVYCFNTLINEYSCVYRILIKIAKWGTSKDDKVNWNWETKEDNKDFKVEKGSKDSQQIAKGRRINNKIEKAIQDQLSKGSCLVKITSRPGQSGRADGVLLEGKELEFYLKKLPKKRA